MSGFTLEWLQLREPADARARAPGLVAQLRERLPAGATVLDLGCGAGANIRYLAPRFGRQHPWIAVDHDPALLEALGRSVSREITVSPALADLRALDALPIPPRGLVTASALLDLVSRPWLDALAHRCAASAAIALFALTYDGAIAFDPPLPDDERVRAHVNAHQGTDKGFGPALGPTAIDAAIDAFAALGYRCIREPSDWELGADQAPLQRALIEDWAGAARAIAPDDAARIDAWRGGRLAALPCVRVRVGHADLLTVPDDT
jgi:SAM-dependent methyltransferase